MKRKSCKEGKGAEAKKGKEEWNETGSEEVSKLKRKNKRKEGKERGG